MIFLEVGDQKYEGFTEINVGKNIETVSGSFGFSTVVDNNFTFKVGQPARVLVDDAPVITGYIDAISFSYSGFTRSISIMGRDKTADLIDSSLKGNIEFNTGITLKRVVENVLKDLGITDIKVFDEANPDKFTKEDLISGSPEDNAFEFIEKYCRLRQVLITSDTDGNIVLTRGGKETMSAVLLNEKGNIQNNIMSAAITYNNSKRFYLITAFSQGNPSASDSSSGIVNILGSANDEEIRTGRNLTIMAEHSVNSKTAKNRAIWEVNFRRAKSSEYSATVAEWKAPTGEIWLPNKLIKVKDDTVNINSFMLISGVRYILNPLDGRKTILTLTTKDAYNLQAQQNQAQAKANLVGDNVR